MKNPISFIMILVAASLLHFDSMSQIIVQKPLRDYSKLTSSAKNSTGSANCLGLRKIDSNDLEWKPALISKPVRKVHKGPDADKIERIKEEKLKLKLQEISRQSGITGEPVTTQSAVTPLVGINYSGVQNTGSSPMDNTIAIGNNGIIVSAANSVIEVDDINGNNLFSNTIENLINDPSFTTPCDPVVIYDPVADRFVFFAQECNGNLNNNEFIAVCFSASNNPHLDGWFVYKLSFHFTNNNAWFDYPKLGLSNNELYVTGNLFNFNGTFTEAILYQIEKANGYQGGNINFQMWSQIDGNPFTLVPLSFGQNGSYGPGCYLVATKSGGGNSIDFYDLTNDMSASNEQLIHTPVSTTTYAPAAPANQSGTGVVLDNGDTRTLSGFFLDNTAHFVFHSDIGGGWNGINYNRLNVQSGTNVSSMIGQQGSFDFCYPTVVSYATSATDKSVMIGFGRSGPSIFPEIRVVNCDHTMNFSSTTLVKAGTSFVSQNVQNNSTRWGDYTGSSRKHNQAPRVWINGSIGSAGNLFNAWNAEILDNTVGVQEHEHPDFRIYPNPMIEDLFYMEFTPVSDDQVGISLHDINGKMIKSLYSGRPASGTNIFSFNKGHLSPGVYFVRVEVGKNLLKNEKIVIGD